MTLSWGSLGGTPRSVFHPKVLGALVEMMERMQGHVHLGSHRCKGQHGTFAGPGRWEVLRGDSFRHGWIQGPSPSPNKSFCSSPWNHLTVWSHLIIIIFWLHSTPGTGLWKSILSGFLLPPTQGVQKELPRAVPPTRSTVALCESFH